SNSQCVSGGARCRHAASSVAPICLHIDAPCVLAWRPRALARNARPLLAGTLMPRVKRSVHGRKKRRKVLAEAKGYWGIKKSSYTYAKEQVEHSLAYAYRD